MARQSLSLAVLRATLSSGDENANDSSPTCSKRIRAFEQGSKGVKIDEDKNSHRSTSELAKEEGCNTRTSQEVTHPSTTLAQARLTSEF